MTSWFSTIGKVVLVLGLVAFLSLGIFGMSHSTMSMEPDGSMTMTNCPLMTGQAVVCNMNPLEHIAAWQGMFETTLQQNGTDFLILLLTALALTLIWTRSFWPRPKRDHQPALSLIFNGERHLPSPLLQELFSSGILNPKVF